jgi:hypothetical protein
MSPTGKVDTELRHRDEQLTTLGTRVAIEGPSDLGG